MLTVLLV